MFYSLHFTTYRKYKCCIRVDCKDKKFLIDLLKNDVVEKKLQYDEEQQPNLKPKPSGEIPVHQESLYVIKFGLYSTHVRPSETYIQGFFHGYGFFSSCKE